MRCPVSPKPCSGRPLPNDRIALQWDVCQEVTAWEGYYEPGPVDFRKETIAQLIVIGDGVLATIELGYHLCYGSPAALST
jgi:hypothetical protein